MYDKDKFQYFADKYTEKIKSNYSNSTINSINSDVAISNAFPNSFGRLHITGYKYGAFYGVSSIWGGSNYYTSPETGKAFSSSNQAKLYNTKGILKILNSKNEVLYQFDLDLCGNDNIQDEINGTAYTKRWSDDFLFTKNLNWSTGDTINNYILFIATMTTSDFGKAPAKTTADEVANLVSNGFKTESYNTVVAGTAYSSVGMYYDIDNSVYKVAFRVNANFFTSPIQFAYETSSSNSNMKLIYRYELEEYEQHPLMINPIVINNGDMITFEPTYNFEAYDINGSAYTIKSIPLNCEISVYGNSAAKIAGENERDILLSVVEQLLNGSDSLNNTIVSEVRSGDEISSQLQKEIDAYSATGGTIYIKSGFYNISSNVTIRPNVSVIGLGDVEITSTATNIDIFKLECGGYLKNIIIKTPLNFACSAILIGGDDVHYNQYTTQVENVKIIGTTSVDSDGASTTFTGKGVSVIANHVNNSYSTVYNACGNNIKVYNMEYGIYVYADMNTDFIANTYFQNIYIENCYIGILDRGFTSAFIGYTIQTKPNNLYGVECYGGYYVGHVYDLDLYWDGDSARPNIGHPKIGYFLGGGEYSFISDPVFTEYQGKYGYEWDNVRPEKKLSFIDNTWDIYRTPNETVAPLKLNGTEQCKAKEKYVDFNGLIDNYICYANERWTVTTNITSSDIVSGSIKDMFDPHIDRTQSLRLLNRSVDDPYVITIDFGEDILISALGMDFDSIPRYVKMEAYNSKYDTEHYSSVEFSDDNFYQVFMRTDNRLSVIQATWSGTGFSLVSKIRFSFADASSVVGNYIIPKNLYAYNINSMAKTYVPSNGGHLYNDGKITVSPDHKFNDQNEYVSKQYVDDFSGISSNLVPVTLTSYTRTSGDTSDSLTVLSDVDIIEDVTKYYYIIDSCDLFETLITDLDGSYSSCTIGNNFDIITAIHNGDITLGSNLSSDITNLSSTKVLHWKKYGWELVDKPITIFDYIKLLENRIIELEQRS